MSIPKGSPPEFNNWRAMISRCYDRNATKYPTYGAKGITVCSEWRGPSGFSRFLAHMGPKPSPQHTIDRFPNPRGNYEPGNVRWATPREQSWNSSAPTMLTIDGETAPLSEWERRSGLARHTIRNRARAGITGKALLAPLLPSKARQVASKRAIGNEYKIDWQGETLSLSECARRFGLSRKGLQRRFQQGMSLEEAAAKPSRQTVSDEQVRHARRLFANGSRIFEIAREVGLRFATVSKIVKGERHREVAPNG